MANGVTDDRLGRLLLKEDVTDFLHHEAELLDDRRFEDWLDLLADDVTYVMPLRLNLAHDSVARSTTREHDETCWFDEDKATLRKRVAQLRTGVHWAEEPVSRVSHLVSNIRVASVTGPVPDPSEVEIRCRFLVYRNRVETETDVWVGRRTDTLRRAGDGWLLARRHLLLDQNVLLAKNLTVIF